MERTMRGVGLIRCRSVQEGGVRGVAARVPRSSAGLVETSVFPGFTLLTVRERSTPPPREPVVGGAARHCHKSWGKHERLRTREKIGAR